MGAVYRPKYRGRDGITREPPVWWVRFRQHGRTVRQSTGTTSRTKAMGFLRQQEGKVALKIPVNIEADRLTLADGAEMIREDYQANGRKSAATLEYRVHHLFAHFGQETRLSRLTTDAVERYKAARLGTGAQPATTNREVACLSRMATLARLRHNLVTNFVATGLEERNVRKGFSEEDAFRAVCRQLRPELTALATVAKITGWRKSEVVSRHWRHVDFTAGWLRVEPEETKPGTAGCFP
ncbi:MAG: hypothetical protein HY002_21600 [Candidatus Rokubacteria bacterium]|nr:hypothetical protein [Candidatus Rokubacteria bacterium]